ncbi:MAG: hypothetical protein C0494_15920 [Sphingobium sp.]|nr:hypothetical protein [Sphingobium sp.]
MANIGKRIEALEALRSAGAVVWHRVIQQSGQTLDEALDAYGRDRIAPDDRLIVRKIVDSRLAAGSFLQ